MTNDFEHHRSIEVWTEESGTKLLAECDHGGSVSLTVESPIGLNTVRIARYRWDRVVGIMAASPDREASIRAEERERASEALAHALDRAEKAEAALADMTTAAAETDSANCGLSDALEKERAENARLREALKPFGMGEYFIPSADDIASEKFLRGCGIPWSDQPTTADHRRARALTGGDHG